MHRHLTDGVFDLKFRCRFSKFLWWGWRDSNSHGLPHMHLKHARIPFRHIPTNLLSQITIVWLRSMPLNLSKPYFFAGDAAGEAVVASFLASSFFAGLVEALAAGEVDAAGEADAAAAGAVGGGVGTGASPTTELPPLMPGNEKIKANNIKRTAATIVAFSSGFCAPRGPKAVWLPAPPNADATSPPFPDCNKITRIRKTQAKT